MSQISSVYTASYRINWRTLKIPSGPKPTIGDNIKIKGAIIDYMIVIQDNISLEIHSVLRMGWVNRSQRTDIEIDR